MRTAVYTGPIGHLRMKTALVRPSPTDERNVLAQFDDHNATLEHFACRDPTMLAFGWWTFRRAEFSVPLQ